MDVSTTWTGTPFRSGQCHHPTIINNNDYNISSDSCSHHNHHDSMVQKKRAGNHCEICGKRLLKLVGWRNYFTLPCKCRHACCKQCMTGRLQCRQRVMRPASFDLLWTFPCPGIAQCGQQLTVDFSKGSSYSKNLVATDFVDTAAVDDDDDDDGGSDDDVWEEEEEEVGGRGERGGKDVAVCGRRDSEMCMSGGRNGEGV